jgi:tRNA/rRNA methyltransferase
MAGTDSTRAQDFSPAPAVILVRPQMGENIGAAARAMKNFGLGEMRLVAPRDGWPNAKALAMSSRADDILKNAVVFADTVSAVADLQAVFATTARPRDMEKPTFSPRVAVADCKSRIAGGQKVGLLFGAEKAGLDNDDVALATGLIHISANPAFSSLNLGQAVLLIGYEWYLASEATEANATAATGDNGEPASYGDLIFFFERLEGFLDARGFMKPVEKRPSMVRNIRNMFTRAGLTEQELRTFHGVISALVREDEDQ